MAFGDADWAVFGCIVGISILIALINAVISRRKQKKSDEFLMGSRDVPLIPTAMSLMSSFLSSITILGYPADVYVVGAMYAFVPFGWIMGGFLVLLLLVPLLYPLKLKSIYEYLELRYKSKAIRIVCAIIGILGQIFYMGACIYGPSLVLFAMVKFDATYGVVVCGLVSIIPTLLGGLKGVIWMDFFQGIIMYTSIIAIIIAGSEKIGGFDEAVDTFREHNARLNLSSNSAQFTVWGAFFGSIVGWFGHMGVSQAGFQRYCAVRSLTRSRLVVFLGILVQASVVIVAFLMGIVVYAFFAGRGCDPIGTKLLSSVNSLVPAIVLNILDKPGVPGLFIASIFCGAYSSVTSSLTATAANLYEDVLKDCLGKKSELFQAVLIRILIIICGVGGMGVAFACIEFGGSILQITIAFINSVAGPVVGIFLMSAIFPQANWIGATVGVLTSFAIVLWMSVGAYLHVLRTQVLPVVANVTCVLPGYAPKTTNATTPVNVTTVAPTPADEPDNPMLPFYSVSVFWYAVIAASVAIFVGLLVSFATRSCVKQEKIEKKYFFSFMHGYLNIVENEGPVDTFGEERCMDPREKNHVSHGVRGLVSDTHDNKPVKYRASPAKPDRY